MFTPILDSSQRRPLYEQLYRYIRGEIEAAQAEVYEAGGDVLRLKWKFYS